MITLDRLKSTPTESENVFFLLPDKLLFEPLEEQTIRYLKAFASFRKIPGYSRLTKAQLLEALS